MASPSWWIMAGLTGPLVGLSFVSSVRSYAEVSAGAGGGCGAVCDPLIGIWAPTFSAYELVAVFLLPFVAIRLMSGDRQSGALKLEAQHPLRPLARVAAKAVALLGGWIGINMAGVVAIGLWRLYGGSVSAPEIATVAAGQLLNAGVTVAIALAAAAVADHPSTAAIATLGATVGAWAIDFVAAIQGGRWQRLADVTPSAMVARFQHGLVETSVTLTAVAGIVAGLVIAAVWLRLGATVGHRARLSAATLAVGAVVVLGATMARGSWDVSEGRINSFPENDEVALRRLAAPLSIEVHLAPEDPRRIELQRSALAKLERATPHVRVTYVAKSASGIYESSDPGYGEIWYELAGRRTMSRTVTDEGVLETIFALGGVSPAPDPEMAFPGHPLAARPAGAAAIFYGLWPGAVALAGLFALRGRTA